MPKLSPLGNPSGFDNQGDRGNFTINDYLGDAEFARRVEAYRLANQLHMNFDSDDEKDRKHDLTPKPGPASANVVPPRIDLETGHEETGVGENLDKEAHARDPEEHEARVRDRAIDDIAQRVARGLAGAKQKTTHEPVSGFLGGRNVENADIKNSGATGTNAPIEPNGQKGAGAPLAERGGDAFVEAKEAHNTTTDTLRPTFGIAPANAVVPTKRQQVESDLLFNDFSVVAPGHGLGVTNKMFLMETARDSKIVYREPLAEPRKYDGPTGLVEVPPLQWQNEITRRDRNVLAAKAIAEEASGVLLEARAGTGSLNVLGDDFGQFQRISDKGLKRPADSPLEPILRTPKAWERVKPLPGVQWARKEFRRLFDSARYPERFEPNVAMEGGATLSKRNSLATFPFPITSG